MTNTENDHVCIVDYGMGNLMSVLRALELIGCKALVSNKPEDIRSAKRIILPGVGAFSVAMDNIKSLGITDVLYETVVEEGKPFLGICLGMQLIAEEGYEHGHHKGLGWIPATVSKFETTEVRLPHMGWNDVKPVQKEKSLFEEIADATPSYYFVHSYHVECDKPYVGSTCDYGQNFVSSIQYKNIYATQFHPEKSQKNGIQLLKNFIRHTEVAVTAIP